MIGRYWKARKKAALRRAMRGYRLLAASGQIGTIDEACARLIRTPLAVPASWFSARIFGAALPEADRATRQYAFLRQVLFKLTPALFAQAGSPGSVLAHPLPRQWQEILANSGVRLSRWRCSALWQGWLLIYWAYGVWTIVRLALVIRIGERGGRYSNFGSFSHFEYIGETHTPRPAADGRSHDIMSWYKAWSGRDPAVRTLTYRVSPKAQPRWDDAVRALETPVLPVLRPMTTLRYMMWALGAASLALLDVARGRWWHPLLLSEAALAALARLVPEHAIARDYLLNLSGWLYRPLWTYEVEQRGANILFYHYSTNSAVFRRGDDYDPEHYTWKITNWPRHLVWDDIHADFVRRAVGQTEVEIVGPIWFSSSPDELPPIRAHSIAAFDIQPFRPSRRPLSSDEYIYYTPETCSAFARDVARACAETGHQMIWKRKRDIGKIAHPHYRKLAHDLKSSQHVQIIDPEHSAVRVIENCEAVISLPFTSTALLGLRLGRPSCYYDPSKMLRKDDRAAGDIAVLQGYDELVAWIRSLRTMPAHSYQQRVSIER